LALSHLADRADKSRRHGSLRGHGAIAGLTILGKSADNFPADANGSQRANGPAAAGPLLVGEKPPVSTPDACA